MLNSLAAEYDANGKRDLFAAMRPFLTPYPEESYAEISKKLGISPGAIKVSVHRLRTRYREMLKQEIARTVIDRDEIDDEIRQLFSTFERR